MTLEERVAHLEALLGQLVAGGGGGGGGITALTGDVIGAGAGSVATTFGSVADKTLLARIAGSTGAPSAQFLTAILDAILGTTQGSLTMRNAGSWVLLPPSSGGKVLTENGAGANLSWNTLAIPALTVSIQSGAYVTVLADSNTCIRHPAADTTPRIWTIASNASVACPVGTMLTFDNEFGAGTLTISIGGTDTLLLVGVAGGTGSRTLASGGQATALKVTATTWRIGGIGLS